MKSLSASNTDTYFFFPIICFNSRSILRKNYWLKKCHLPLKISVSHRESEWDPSDMAAKPVWVTSHPQSPLSKMKSLTVLRREAFGAFRISRTLKGTHQVLTSLGTSLLRVLLSVPLPQRWVWHTHRSAALSLPRAAVFLAALGSSLQVSGTLVPSTNRYPTGCLPFSLSNLGVRTR